MNNPIINPMAGPMAVFLQDPVINLRRRMAAILAEVYDQINQNRNQSDMAGRLADWFFAFRNAILRSDDMAGIIRQQLPLLQTLLNNPQFQTNPVVQNVMQTFIPRLHTLLAPQNIPIPVPPAPNTPPPVPQGQQPSANNRDEALRQIRARVLGNQTRRAQEDVQIGQQVAQQLNATLQQGFDNVRQDMQRTFQRNMQRLDRMAEEDRARVARANQVIDGLENVLADVEATLPQSANHIEAVNRALDGVERAIENAKQELVQLNEAINRKKESESNSIFSTVLCIAACILISAMVPQLHAVPRPGGFLVGAQIIF